MIEKSPILKLTRAARQFWLTGVAVSDRDSLNRAAGKTPQPIKSRSSRAKKTLPAVAAFVLLLLASLPAFAETAATNALAATSTTSALPDPTASIVRVFGALLLVIALFLAGVWLFRNWQRFATKKTGGAKLNLLEVKSLGQRQSLYVVGYQQQRMLLASSPAGITLVSHLPAADEAPEIATETSPRMSFAEAFQQVLNRK